ncbi:MAG: hypothetical protein ABW199_10440 [Caulobacterales bacterium]
MRSLLLVLFIAACASAVPSGELPPLGVALSCNAEREEVCGAGGCQPADASVPVLTPVSISLPAGDGGAEVCVATGCSDARVTRVPLSRTPDWAARLEPEAGMAGVVTVSNDRRRFEYTHAGENGAVSRWSGACEAARS